MINVIGLGYIGLPTALMLAANNQEVIGTDINDSLVERLNNQQLSFQEEGLSKLLIDAIDNQIRFQTTPAEAEMYIIAVPTPYAHVTKKIDPTYVIDAIQSILPYIKKEAIIVIESTVSPGTTKKMIQPMIDDEIKTYPNKKIHLVHAPERIIPGNMIHELKYNARTIGADSFEVAKNVKKAYESFCEGEIVLTDIRSAEMSKVIENTYRDVNIAFANELAKICRSDDMDVYEIIRIANKHPRVNILNPGPGVGGHCISVDPWFLVGDYPDITNLILSARKINDSMPDHVLKRIRTIMKKKNVKDISRVGLYGLTYKENVDDIRESPTLQLLKLLDEHLSFGIKVFDPFIKAKIVDNQVLDFNQFIEQIDIIVIMVSHDHLLTNQKLLENLEILDTKNILNDLDTHKL